MAAKERKESKVIRVKHWPEGDRPQKRLLEKGPEGLSDASLLAVLLRTNADGKDALSIAHDVLTEFGGFKGLKSASREELTRIKRIGKARAAQILAAMEIIKRQLREPLEKVNLLQNPKALQEYLGVSMRDLDREEWRLIHLGRSNHLVAEEVLFRGAEGTAVLDAGEVARSALRRKASALILAHNHPGGLPRASEEDIGLTRSLVQACSAVAIPVIDHIVVGRSGFMSMKSRFPNIFEGEDEVA
ncbi:MAG: DNA repair protein RadC [Deltaproteobacteria bacterium]|nr:DNA repair protein RadC [Deltaproteobacteria bacterium]